MNLQPLGATDVLFNWCMFGGKDTKDYIREGIRKLTKNNSRRDEQLIKLNIIEGATRVIQVRVDRYERLRKWTGQISYLKRNTWLREIYCQP